jgi:calcineurin-like phosphoesterase family protein
MEKITISKDFKGKIFFTSDTHWRHGNIIKYCDRPFVNVQEMDHALIQNWNKVVSKDDIVFHLGDFAFADKSKWRQIANSLNGTKYLVQGNHDRTDDIPTECFEMIRDMLQIAIYDEELEDYSTFIMSHYPLATWAGISRSICNLHGHIHSTPDLNGTGFDIVIAKNAPWNQYDVGVDRNNFTPVSYEDLKTIFTKRMLYGNKSIKGSRKSD